MRALPRTPRGTWALAAAVWAAGCWGLWSVLPVCPRVEWELPINSFPVGVLPDQTLLTASLTHITLAGDPVLRSPSGPLRLWRDGRLLREFLSPADRFSQSQVSRTARWLALFATPTLRLLDLTDGHVTEAPVGVDQLDGLFFGPADRRLSYVAGGTLRHLTVPDLKPGGPEVAIVSMAWPSPDGTALATVDF